MMAGGAADVAAAAADSAAAAAAPPEQQQEKATCKCNGGRCHDCGVAGGNPKLMPSAAYEAVRRIVIEQKGGLPDDFPEEDKIKSKVSAMKSTAKKKAKSAAVN